MRRFRQQLIAGLAVEIALLVIVCAIAIGSLTGVTREANREAARATAELELVHNVRVEVAELVGKTRAFLLTKDERYLTELAGTRVALERALAAIPDDPTAAREHAAVEREVRAYTAATEDAIRARERVADLPALEQLYEQRLAPRRETLRDALLALSDANRAHVEAMNARAEEMAYTATVAMVVASGTAIILAILLGVLVGRRLARSFEQVQASQQVASDAALARKELLDMVSHDLRSPLNTIVLGLDALREDHRDLPHLRPIENAANRMQRLVDDLLDVARAQTSGLELELSQHDSHELLRIACEQFAERAERAGVDLRIDHASHATLVADRDRVLQILSNLIGNALKVTPRGGGVVLACDDTPEGVRFTVRDSGPGLGDENITDLFEAYRQGRSGTRRGSLGLGLYISKTLTQAHGGRIGVEPAQPKGSTFWFVLPQHPPGELAAKPT